MTYSATHPLDIGPTTILAEWTWTMSRYYPETRTDPEEPSSPEDITLVGISDDNGNELDCPAWLYAVIAEAEPSDAWFCEQANEQAESDACEAADWRREERAFAAE